ncbi:hypothetical protein JCM6882_009015 [Rhodosporidiobolus microsporus]
MPVRTLPPELVADILDTFVETYPSHAQRLPNLAAFALVDRTWSAISTAYLYRNLYLCSSSRDSILAALESNPALAAHVRTLTLSGGKLSPSSFARLTSALKACTHVRSLSYHCFDAAYLGDLTTFIGDAWPGLRYLRADQSQHLFDLLARLPDLEELIASYIEFPAAAHNLVRAVGTPLPPSRPATPGVNGASTPILERPPVRPTFRLKRFDSGSSPSPLNFHLLTSSSQPSLHALDLPISSLTSQDLGRFSSLSHLTLTLAERYLPLDADLPPGARQPGAPGSGRDDPRCLRRLKRVLRGAEAAQVPLRKLEIYEPRYAPTSAFRPETFEGEDVLSAVPGSVRELDMATVAVSLSYIREAFSRRGRSEGEEEEGEGEEGEKDPVCEGLRTLVLGRGSVGSATEVRETLGVLARRGVAVRWA